MSKRIPRGLLAIMTAAVVGGGLAACGGDDSSSAAGGDNSPAVKSADDITGKIEPGSVETKDVRVAVDNPHYLFQEDALIAQEKGFFKEYGINSYKGSVTDEVVPALIGGSVDMVLFDTDTTMGAAEKTGEDLTVVQMYIEQEANVLGCRKGMNTAEDLMNANAKIAVSGQGTRSYAKMQQLLEENGVDLGKVRLLDTGGQSNERLQQVINSTVDCGSLQLRHRSILEDAGGKFVFQKTYDSPQLALATTCKFINDNPNTVAAYIAATLKARQYIIDESHKDDVLSLMEQKGFELPQAYKDAYPVENAPTYRGQDGGFDPEEMTQLIKEQIDLGEIQELDWKKHVDLVPLWTAQKNLGMDLRPAPSAISGGAC